MKRLSDRSEAVVGRAGRSSESYDDYYAHHSQVPNFEVDDVRFVQPVGFVWFRKPRYRVKALSIRT